MSDYTARINRVIDYIDAHLADALDLQTLASVAHFSPWHFHRLFQALSGETVAERVRRRRLEVAALRLVMTPPVTALSIALDVGFGSAEAFTRAFKTHFGVTPSAWRRGGFRAWAQQRRQHMDRLHERLHGRRAHDAIDAVFRSAESVRREHRAAPVDAELRTLAGTRVAYMRHVGPYGDPAIGAMWRRFNARTQALGLADGRHALFGISHDSPDITAPDKCRYDACVEVDGAFQRSADVGVQWLPGGLYACVPFRGRDDQIHAAWMRLFAHWLPASGYQPDDRPALEAYGHDASVDADGSFACMLCLPVASL